MMPDLVSIVMPACNTGEFIADSIASVLAQTYADWELIVVDDCSTDDTPQIVASFRDDRIRYFRNDKNCGAALSRNRALREAKGRWIAFLDSDDLWLPEKLEKQIAFMEKNRCVFSYTAYVEMDTSGAETGITVSGPKRIRRDGMRNYCWPGCLTVMYEREAIGLIQVADLARNNDYAIWLRASRRAECLLLDEVLAKYRRGRKGSVSTQTMWTKICWHYRLFRIGEAQSAPAAHLSTFRNLGFGVWKKVRYVRH